MAQPIRHRSAEQLPPGRHKLGREFVVANQRARILEAVTDVNSLAGYNAMSVEDIIRTAGVSRRSFYDLFADREEAFLAALDIAIERLMEALRREIRRSAGFADGVRRVVQAGLSFVEDDPRDAEMLLLDAPAAGPAAVARRRRTIRRLSALLHDRARRELAAACPPALTAEAIVGGIFEVAYARVLSGEIRALRALTPDLVYAVLQPYLGAEAARVAAEPTVAASLTAARSAARA